VPEKDRTTQQERRGIVMLGDVYAREETMGATLMTYTRRAAMAVGLLALMGPLPALCQSATKRVYHIALSNSYIGNQWRVEMVNLTKAYAEQYFKGKVVLTIVNSGTDVQRQISAMDDMISAKVDTILVDPASEAGLNPVIAEATRRGIVVVDFDHAVSAPQAYKVGVDFVKFGELQAQWLVDTLHGKGNIILNRGVPGFQGDQAEYQGEMNVIKKYPGIRVVDEVYGKWDENVSQAVITEALTAHPDIQGVVNQAGAYGAVRAFQNLHHAFVPMTGEASNGWRVAMLNDREQGLKGISVGDPPTLGAYALKEAVEILDGHAPKSKEIVVNIPTLRTDELKEGINVFSNLPPTVYDDIEIPGSGIHLTMPDALGH
jgi:ribose transport system substrate-binding protein